MKKAIILAAAFMFIFSTSIMAVEPADPLAGDTIEGDFGMPADPTVQDGSVMEDPLARDGAGAAIMPDETGIQTIPGDGAASDDPFAGDMAGDPLAGDMDMAGDPLAGDNAPAGDSNFGGDPFATDGGGATVDGGVAFDAAQGLPGDEGTAVPQVMEPAKKTKAEKAVVKKGLPKYKAVPLTNDIRPMTRDGKLGQVESLARYMDWGYEASSTMKKQHKASNLKDSNITTAWVEGKDDYGIGESVTFLMDPVYFAPIHEGEVEAVNWTGFKVINGYNKSKEDWTNNSRVKLMKIYLNKKAVCRIELYDTTNWQTVTFPKAIRVKPGDRIKCVIEDAYEAYMYPNIAMSEFILTGEPEYELVGEAQIDGHSRLGKRN
ncbi:MAG: hypothetical protein LLG37_11240 [Spirochaetia bacterium]|nr:hypothetical protein [Spirochaetia bacterium]